MEYGKKILLLGSGELGRELTISLQRLGHYVIAVDSYNHAPAMQLAQAREVINMLDGAALDKLVEKHRPDLIVPKVEAIRTERFYDYEKQGFTVVPSAKAANFTMNRKAIRDLAAKELHLRTAAYRYATNPEEFRLAVSEIGIPCVVKPLMSSSGKGQSVIRLKEEVDKAWDYAMAGSRGDYREVIIEEFIRFESEITLLTVTQKKGPTLFCPPIGHRQEHGDYRESWQPPCEISAKQLQEAQQMASEITKALGGAGIWGVEFFLGKEHVYFSELSPRPHDTGMVTLAGTQNLSEFDLHARTILGLPIPSIEHMRNGASAVVLASAEGQPDYHGIPQVLSQDRTDVRIFNKPTTRPNRRMGVVLVYADKSESGEALAKRAASLASMIRVECLQPELTKS